MVTRNEMQHHNTNNTGSPQQFCLRWNNYQSNLTNVFDQLLQSESFVDVTLACDGHSLKAHKMVLSACSPYFQSLFNDNPCHHPIVIMRDIKWPELKSAVEFMYKGEINVSQEQIGPLLKVAETLKIRGLADVNDLGQGEVVARPTSKPMPLIDTANSPPSDWSSSGNGGPLISGRELKCEQPPPQPPPPPSSSSSVQQQSNAASEMSSIISGAKKRRRSPERRSSSPISPPNNIIGGGGGGAGDLMMGEISGNSVVEMSPSAPSAHTPSSSSAMACEQSSMALPSLGLPPPINQTVGMGSHQADDMEIKPGIAEMIREEERAKLLESSHAWLASSASTSSLAEYPQLLKLKTPTWTQDQLKEAIDAVVQQKLRFTQASVRFGIPKGTLYDNILGKSKRMAVLEEAALTPTEETAVLEFCCDVSVSPYNRRTKKSLKEVLNFVEKIRRVRDPEFIFTGLSGFKWWWAFCKRHSIVSLYYENNNPSNNHGSSSLNGTNNLTILSHHHYTN